MIDNYEGVHDRAMNGDRLNDEVTIGTVYGTADQMFEVNRFIPVLGVYQLW